MRMNLFVLVRILFQYLERVDPSSLDLAKEVLKDCERKHNTKDSKYETLADAINERVRDAVGESHWAQARKIQKQLMINQQRKKLRAMKVKQQSGSASKLIAARKQHQRMSSGGSNSGATTSDQDMEAAEAMSALAGMGGGATATAGAPSRGRTATAAEAKAERERDATPPRSNHSRRFRESLGAVDEDMGGNNLNGGSSDQTNHQGEGSRQG